MPHFIVSIATLALEHSDVLTLILDESILSAIETWNLEFAVDLGFHKMV